MDGNMQGCKKSDKGELGKNNTFLKSVIVNNLLSVLINCSVVTTAVATIVVIDALTGFGMGLEFFAVPAAAGAYIYLGYKLLTPTQKHLWMSVMGSVVVVTAAFILGYVQAHLPLGEIFIAALVIALVPSLFMYLGLRMRVKDNSKRQT